MCHHCGLLGSPVCLWCQIELAGEQVSVLPDDEFIEAAAYMYDKRRSFGRPKRRAGMV